MSTTPTPSSPARRGRRARGDEGVALVEFAFVFILFFTMLFGIIAFGVVLSFQQTLTQAANEAARAAAVTTNNPLTPADERQTAAMASVQQFNNWGRTCSHPGMGTSCQLPNMVAHDCGGLTQTALLPDCITVRLEYDYAGHPILPNFPMLDGFLPDTLRANATAQISDVDPTP